MNLAIGILLFWIAMMGFYTAFHKYEGDATPWGAFQKLAEKIAGGGGAEDGGDTEGSSADDGGAEIVPA